jgi:hypothetical protein
VNGTPAGALCCERYLFAHFHPRFRIVSESGFEVAEEEAATIAAAAEETVPALQAIVLLQRGPLFEKERQTGTDWIAHY